MFEVLNKQILANDVRRLDIHCPLVAQKVRPGQFVRVCGEKGGEHIPLTVIDSDADKGAIALIFQEVGPATRHLGGMTIGDSLHSILGPLGVPSVMEKKGTVICVATGIAGAQILPICRALREAGNKVIGVLGAKTKRALIAESQMRLACDRIFVVTDDGSYERKGQATDMLAKLMEQQSVDRVYAIGSVQMMRRVALMTAEAGVECRVHLNPVMADCMGMCGSCRIRVGGKTILACMTGPEFDAHKVDFDYFRIRVKAYEETEEWLNQRLQSSRLQNEPATFMKLLSGILRK